MNKVTTYGNVNEYIKITFPKVYKSKSFADENSLESILKNNSDDFSTKMINIFKKDKRRITNG